MDPSSLESSVVELNNVGLSHFLSGDYQKAIDSLGMACHVIDRYQFQAVDRQQSVPNGPQQVYSACDDTGSISSTMDQYIEQVLRKTPPSKNPEPSNFSTSSSGTVHSLYNRGLVMSTGQCGHILTGEYMHRTSAVILYNLALVYHNMGVRQGISAALPHALQMYESAFHCLRRVSCIVECHKLLLAILNNMGNIYAQSFQVDHTVECFKQLRQALSIPNPSMDLDEDYIFFLLNALFQPK
eukprot:CAMPEP_0113629194 /NCGR_PEP_ID=MMETSP0017_2-20120614/15151_1 /TAXON_ID=2856 /ORGANISM="Cylindrotheca closterium" /LENGTH=240 /DNA_ID=CAMNT_0000539575 /DNA_START=159 /DNA_END=878 /DNA_ORIENTATION=+ /assembly_acc=CAM_ASM_000147